MSHPREGSSPQVDTISSIFAFESTRLRQRAAPLLQEREQLLLSMLEQGTPIRRLRSIAAMLLHVIRIMELQSLRVISLLEIEESSLKWIAQPECQNRNRQAKGAKFFVYVATKWFRFHRVFESQITRNEPDSTYLEKFIHHLTCTRGLAVKTVQTSRQRVAMFLRWTTDRKLALGSVAMTDVDAYLQSKWDIGYKPRSIFSICSALRLFFLFAEREGWSGKKISMAIRRPRVGRHDNDPRGPEWSDVRRMLDHDFGSKIPDLRGDAVVALAAIYALRSCEIIRLKLDDFDWTNEILTIRRAKSDRVQQYPIQVEVGEKIIRYLRYSRPKTTCRSVFVSLRPPYRPMDQACLWVIVSSRLKALGIESKNLGTHALRHSCATRLLHQGSSLPDIAHFLGHSDLKSVSVYAKHDHDALREVASVPLAMFI